jgi:hypothetical protein
LIEKTAGNARISVTAFNNGMKTTENPLSFLIEFPRPATIQATFRADVDHEKIGTQTAFRPGRRSAIGERIA